MAYLLDANVFIQAKNLHYGFDFCPAFWDWLIEKNSTGEVYSIEKVGDEIEAGFDELAAWVGQQGSEFFVKPDAAIIPALRDVSTWVTGQKYEPAAVNTFLQVADYYLIASALAHGHTVITHEKPSASLKRIKIPEVCIGLNVKFMSPYEMLRHQRLDLYSEILNQYNGFFNVDKKMEFRISDTFTDSLSRLTGEEQKAVKTTAFDLQLNSANPGMSFHKLDKAKDKNFWSVRVSSDIRLIVHRTPESLLLCYVDHHDDAYRWAERRKIVDKEYSGPARVSGSAGTGKTIVALHRAVFLAKKNPEARVLLTTFSEPLANALRNKLKVLLKHTPRIGEHLDVYQIDEI